MPVVDLEGLGKAISETIALKKIVVQKQNKAADIGAQIIRNVKEIERLQSLTKTNKDLKDEREFLIEEIKEDQKALDERLDKLKNAGVDLEPLETNVAKGFMVL